ncbi:hypothetical protein, partial [Streptomyces clavuligerus]|uniref:hypothetical protein n=1 Tax=Streptomyces clavuligerus TaxID=1901 RepID=UPI0018D0BE8E
PGPDRGGAVASAIWAGGLWAYEAGPPDTGGYRASRDLCTDVPLRSITAILGMPEPGLPTSTTHPDRSTAACQYLFPPPGKDGSFDRPGVHLVYTLHRRTDPGPEFEAAVQARADREKPGAALETVDGLGERAYVHGADSSAATLHVLDGQATLTLSLTTSAPTRSDPTGVPTDLTAVQDSAVQDLRAALDALRS